MIELSNSPKDDKDNVKNIFKENNEKTLALNFNEIWAEIILQKGKQKLNL
ncbi:MAG: hypothetical protein RSD67_05725 [Oscillospiraceae bacterium]